MVEVPEGIRDRLVDECGRSLPVSGSGDDSVRDATRPTPGSPEAAHDVRKVRPGVVQVGVLDADHHVRQFAWDQPLGVPVLGEGALLG